MIPVLIVDDEYLIRSLVRNSVDWTELGFSIVAEAEDGDEALRLVEELRPRLMVVDINIPFINGLDLSMRIRASHPEIKIVILTGYEDFQFARKAIKVGVVDYLLKPLNPEELEKAVMNAREEILGSDAEALVAAQGAIQSADDALRALLSADTASAAYSFLKQRVRISLDLDAAPTVVCVLDIDPPVPPAAIRDRFDFPCELFAYRGGRVVMFAAEDARTVRLKDKNYYLGCDSLIADFVAAGRTVSVGIGGPAAGSAELGRSYEQAAAALENAFYLGTNRIHSYAALESAPEHPLKVPSLPPRESMIMLLRSGSAKNLIQQTQGLFRDLGRVRAARPYCEMLCLEILFVVNEYLKDAGLSIKEILETEEDYYLLVGKLKTLGEMENWLVDLIKLGEIAVDTQGKGRTHLVVKKAKSFIDKNYARKGLTLDLIAEHASVTASYVSSIFKKELGISLIEYLTNVRLDAAKRMMDADPLVTIIDVADRSGYSDPYYFSKCFRKRFGLPPTAYLHKKNPSAFD